MRNPEIQISEQSIESEDLKWIDVYVIWSERVVGSCRLESLDSECPLLMSLFVVPHCRRQGIATMLIEACLKLVRSLDKRSLVLIVGKKNEAAENLYRKLGFQQFTDDDTRRWMAMPLEIMGDTGQTRNPRYETQLVE